MTPVQAPAGQPVADLVAALRSARHDLWLFVEAATSDDETIRGEVAIRAIDEAIARATGSEQ